MRVEGPPLPDGRRNRRHIYGRSQAEVRARAAEVAKAIEEQREQPDGRMSLADWCARWLERTEPRWDDTGRRTGNKHSTWRSYEMHVRLNISPSLIGRKQLRSITVALVQDWIDWLGSTARGLSPRSVQLALTTLKEALKAAADAQQIPSPSPIKGMSAPKQTAYKASIFTLEQAKQFIAACAGHPMEALFLLAAFGGPRQGEALALSWEDIDLDKGTVRYLHTLDWIDGQPVREENKTNASRRTVHLPGFVLDSLRRHRTRQAALRFSEPDYTDYGLVFTRDDGYPRRGGVVDKQFHKLLADTGLPRIRWHDLRHSAASIGLAAGLSLFEVKSNLGWGTLEMLNQRYGHVVPEIAAERVKLVEQLLKEEDPADGTETIDRVSA